MVNFPECCHGYGISSRRERDGEWMHHWTVPNGKEGDEPCSFAGSTEELMGFHAMKGWHFRAWNDVVVISQQSADCEEATIELEVPIDIWRSVMRLTDK